jgi:uridylate kinase
METVVISLGGSLIVPSDIDVNFLKRFKHLILKFIKTKRFIIICGGGKTCRKYQDAAGKITKLTHDDLDWLGIHSTRLNGHLLRTIFREYAHSKMVTNMDEEISFSEPILIAAGYKPGHSTDYDAILLAKKFGIKTLINLTDMKYVYDKDPDKYKNAKPFKKMRWNEYRKISGSVWNPGLSLPFDPVAAKEAQKMNLKVVVMNGRDIKNLENFLNGKKFEGTVIKD